MARSRQHICYCGNRSVGNCEKISPSPGEVNLTRRHCLSVFGQAMQFRARPFQLSSVEASVVSTACPKRPSSGNARFPYCLGPPFPRGDCVLGMRRIEALPLTVVRSEDFTTPYWTGPKNGSRSRPVGDLRQPLYFTSFLYLMRCGWSASVPIRCLRISS